MCAFGGGAQQQRGGIRITPLGGSQEQAAAASARSPNGGSLLDGAGRRAKDRPAAYSSGTVLTSGMGVGSFAPTEKKTLLGQ